MKETVLGSVQVSVRLGPDTEMLTLFFTQTRVILAHIGKRGLGKLSGMSMLGQWSGALGALFKSPGERQKKKLAERGLREMSPGEILDSDKNSFDISYTDVVRVELDNNPLLVGILMLTRDDKYEFYTQEGFAKVSKLLRNALGEKVESR